MFLIDELEITLIDSLGLNDQEDTLGAAFRPIIRYVRKVLQSKLLMRPRQKLNRALTLNISNRRDLRKIAQDRAVEYERTQKDKREKNQLDQRVELEEEDIAKDIIMPEESSNELEQCTSRDIQKKDDETCRINKQDQQNCLISTEYRDDPIEEVKSMNPVMEQAESVERAMRPDINDNFNLMIEEAEDSRVKFEDRAGNESYSNNKLYGP